jgi:hypothetical protein
LVRTDPGESWLRYLGSDYLLSAAGLNPQEGGFSGVFPWVLG